MRTPTRIRLLPADRCLEVDQDVALREVLHEHGEEFPCRGDGRIRMGMPATTGAASGCVTPDRGAARVDDMAGSVEHVSLVADPTFQDVFVEEMRFS